MSRIDLPFTARAVLDVWLWCVSFVRTMGATFSIKVSRNDWMEWKRVFFAIESVFVVVIGVWIGQVVRYVISPSR